VEIVGTDITYQTLSCISTAFNVTQLDHGGGRHTYYLQLPQAIESSKYVDLAQLFLIIITCITKVSICLFLIRIPNSKRLIHFLYVLMGALILVNGLCAIVYILQCRPFQALYDPTVTGQCWSIQIYKIFGYIQGSMSSVCFFHSREGKTDSVMN